MSDLESLLAQAGLYANTNTDLFHDWYGQLSPEEQQLLRSHTDLRLGQISDLLKYFQDDFLYLGDTLNQVAEAIVTTFKPVLEAIINFIDQVRDDFLEFLESLYPYIIKFRRLQLYLDLRAWHIPAWLACPLAYHWPTRFLPDLRAGP